MATRRMLSVLAALVVLAAHAALVSCTADNPPVPPVAGRATLPPPPRDGVLTPEAPSQRAIPTHRSHAWRGREFFARHCTECHGAEGRADGVRAKALRPPPTDFTDVEYMRGQRPSWFYQALTAGVPGTAMARWDHRLDDLDRWDTAYYAWSLGLEPGALERGRVVYEAWCETCHGADGNLEPGATLGTADRARDSRAALAEGILSSHEPDDVPPDAADVDAAAAFVATFLFEPSRHFNERR